MATPIDYDSLSDEDLLKKRFEERKVVIDKVRPLSQGRYSKVMTAGLKDGSTIAIKIINTAKVTNEFRTKFLPREIECWEKLRHSHLIKLLYRDEIGGRVFLFMEYGQGGDMLAHVQKNGPVHEATAALWMRQIISGISYMHKLNFVHRDLKLENIIIFSATTVKIADFGFARRMGNDPSVTYCGSKSYSAPEILSGQPYNPYKADVWSMGVIAYNLVTGSSPFDGCTTENERMHRMKFHLYSIPSSISASCRSLLFSMLNSEPESRPECDSILSLPWIEDVDKTAPSLLKRASPTSSSSIPLVTISDTPEPKKSKLVTGEYEKKEEKKEEKKDDKVERKEGKRKEEKRERKEKRKEKNDGGKGTKKDEKKDEKKDGEKLMGRLDCPDLDNKQKMHHARAEMQCFMEGCDAAPFKNCYSLLTHLCRDHSGWTLEREGKVVVCNGDGCGATFMSKKHVLEHVDQCKETFDFKDRE